MRRFLNDIRIDLKQKWINFFSYQPNQPCGEWNDEMQGRIVGGVKTNPHRYPWLAVVFKHHRFHCGGSIINTRYVLTAGHCVFDEDSRKLLPKEIFDVTLGAYDRYYDKEPSRQNYKILEIKVPALFHGDPMHDVHDLGLLKVDRKIIYTPNIRPICLPASGLFPYDGRFGIISGWGTLSFKGKLSQFPLEAAVQVISDDNCMKSKIVGSHFAENPNAMFCAYRLNTDACQGDSGGPIIVQDNSRVTQIGVISWGIECALPGHPGVYTRLTNYVEWVYNNTLDSEYCQG